MKQAEPTWFRDDESLCGFRLGVVRAALRVRRSWWLGAVLAGAVLGGLLGWLWR